MFALNNERTFVPEFREAWIAALLFCYSLILGYMQSICIRAAAVGRASVPAACKCSEPQFVAVTMQ